MNFIELCVNGEAFADEIDDYVDLWHEGAGDVQFLGQPLREYLGFTEHEYVRWMMDPEVLLDILAERTAVLV